MEKSINVKIYMNTISLSKKAMCIMIYSCEIDEEEKIEKHYYVYQMEDTNTFY